MEEWGQMDKPLHDLIEIIHFTESVSAKIHGVLDEAEIYRTLTEEFAKSKRYTTSIMLLTEDGLNLRIAETSLAPHKVKEGEKAAGLRLKGYKIDLNKSRIYSEVVREGKTVQTNVSDVICELFPRPLAYLISKIMGYEKKPSILTPLNRHGKIIGALAVSSTDLAEHFIPSVRNLAQHISTALELADEHAVRKRAEEALRESKEKLRNIFSTMSDGVTLVGLDGRILDCNDAVLRLHSVSKDEYVGRSVYDFIAPEDRQRAIQEASAVLEKGSIRSEVKALKKKGGIFNAEIDVSLLRDASGKPKTFLGVTRDITEKKKMGEKLRESEERFRNLYESIRDPVGVFVGREGRLVDHNKAFNKLSGYTDEELKDKTFLDFVHPDDHALVLERYRTKYPEEQLPLVYEIRAVNKKGEIIPLEISVSPYKVKDKVIGIEVIHRDITERKKAEEELICLSSAVKMSTDSIVISDLDGKIIDANEATLKMYGTDDKRDLIEKNSFNLIAPEEREKALEGMKEVLEKGYIKGREYHVVTKDGSRIPVEMSVAIMKDADGKPIGFVGISRDITERKQMEEKLRQYSERLEELVQKRTEELLESEKRYSVLVEEASDGVAILQDQKIVFTNKRGAEIIGYSRDEIIGVPFEKVVDEEYLQLVKERYIQRLRGEMIPTTYEIELIAKTGECIPIELSGARIHYQGRPADLLIVRDIRERKRMEEERLRLEKLAAIGELATMVGHDLRNPLQSIENAVYYLNSELPFLSPSLPNAKKAMAMLQVINDSVNYADKIIRDLQDFSATKTPTLEKTDINTIVEETLLQVQIPKNVELITEMGHLPEIKVDKDMIKRVFLNLALNGVQAMENGGLLTVSTKKTSGFVEISFKDTGVGISKENMEKIFTPFFTTRAKGMGMGLPICKKFVEGHGGTIQLESEEGKGSTFTVKLPIQQENGGENP